MPFKPVFCVFLWNQGKISVTRSYQFLIRSGTQGLSSSFLLCWIVQVVMNVALSGSSQESHLKTDRWILNSLALLFVNFGYRFGFWPQFSYISLEKSLWPFWMEFRRYMVIYRLSHRLKTRFMVDCLKFCTDHWSKRPGNFFLMVNWSMAAQSESCFQFWTSNINLDL